MNKHNTPNPTSGTAKTITPTRNSGPNMASPAATQPERTPNPNVMDRETAKKGSPKDEVKAPAKTAVKEPLHVAKKDDDMMGKKPKKS